MLQEASVDPDDKRRVTAAFEAALQLLDLHDRDDAVTELLARKIIETARTGEHDPARICAQALKELGLPPVR